MQHKLTVLLTEKITHDVRRIILEKPDNYEYKPGQATEVSIDKDGFRDKKHPFTFTSLNRDKVLEFTIKIYPVKDNPNHKGLTESIDSITPGDNLIIGEPFGKINYQGKGVFIAGGAGITPFIAIIKNLHAQDKLSGNKLIFSNKLRKDVILENFWRYAFDDNLVLTLTEEKLPTYNYGRIDESLLQESVTDFSQKFYVCGPPAFVSDINSTLKTLGASPDTLVFEE